jgi:hypothetical protein
MQRTNAKKDGIITGVLFITAAVSSIIGLKLYDPVLTASDFLASGNSHYAQVVLGAINELLLIVSATGTGIMLYSYLKKYDERLGLGYLSFRLLEVVFIVIGTLSVLTVLSISKIATGNNAMELEHAKSLGISFIALHKWTFIMGPNFMLAVNTFIYSYTFYRIRVIPPHLARFGMVAACFIMLAAILELFGIIAQISIWGILLALPIALYEMTLAVYLIKYGFRLPAEKDIQKSKMQ